MSDRLKYRMLEAELQPYRKLLGDAADTIINQEVSDYPIFVVHKGEVAIGIPIVKKEDVQLNWSINASTLEEFATKNLIQPDKINGFREVFKDPEEELCLFVLSELGASFIFIPRKGTTAAPEEEGAKN